MDRTAVAREYYRAIDEGAYDALSDLLAEGFAHDRPDRTLEGRERFVAFVREERPMTDTEHAVDAVYRGADGVAVRGRLLRDGVALFGFVDVFAFDGDRITRLETYTDGDG